MSSNIKSKQWAAQGVQHKWGLFASKKFPIRLQVASLEAYKFKQLEPKQKHTIFSNLEDFTCQYICCSTVTDNLDHISFSNFINKLVKLVKNLVCILWVTRCINRLTKHGSSRTIHQEINQSLVLPIRPPITHYRTNCAQSSLCSFINLRTWFTSFLR